MHAQRAFENLATDFAAIGRIDRLCDHGNTGQRTDSVGLAEDFVASRCALLLKARCFGTQHQMRKIDVPLVRRHVGALRHVAHVAQIAVINDIPVDFGLGTVSSSMLSDSSTASNSVGNELHRLKQRRQP